MLPLIYQELNASPYESRSSRPISFLEIIEEDAKPSEPEYPTSTPRKHPLSIIARSFPFSLLANHPPCSQADPMESAFPIFLHLGVHARARARWILHLPFVQASHSWRPASLNISPLRVIYYRAKNSLARARRSLRRPRRRLSSCSLTSTAIRARRRRRRRNQAFLVPLPHAARARDTHIYTHTYTHIYTPATATRACTYTRAHARVSSATVRNVSREPLLLLLLPRNAGRAAAAASSHLGDDT